MRGLTYSQTPAYTYELGRTPNFKPTCFWVRCCERCSARLLLKLEIKLVRTSLRAL